MSKNKKQRSTEIGIISVEIEAISLSQAFTICSPCFGERVAKGTLKKLLSSENKFLFEKDSNGQYPIHRMIMSCSYCVDTVSTVHWRVNFHNFIIKTILKHAPQCARQFNDDGLLPLHIAADSQQVKDLTDKDRLNLVRIIWNTYPEAAEVIEKTTALPPFALAVRSKDKEAEEEEEELRIETEHQSLSTSFFLLKQFPEVLSEYIHSDGTNSASVPPAKSHKSTTSTWYLVKTTEIVVWK